MFLSSQILSAFKIFIHEKTFLYVNKVQLDNFSILQYDLYSFNVYF